MNKRKCRRGDEKRDRKGQESNTVGAWKSERLTQERPKTVEDIRQKPPREQPKETKYRVEWCQERPRTEKVRFKRYQHLKTGEHKRERAQRSQQKLGKGSKKAPKRDPPR